MAEPFFRPIARPVGVRHDLWTVAVSVRISDPFLRDELADFLRHATCRVTVKDRATITVEVPGAHADEDRPLIDLFIAGWHGLHPNVDATRLEEGAFPKTGTRSARASRSST